MTWQAVDPQAAAAAAVIQRQVQQRYGITVDQLQTRSDRDGTARDEVHRNAAGHKSAAEQTEAGRILGDVGRDERAGERDVVDYDSPARRQDRADRLRDMGQDPESIAAAMSADLSQARPAKDAVTVPIKVTGASAAPVARQPELELGR